MLVLPNICNLLRRLASSATTTVGNKPPYQIKEVILLDDKEINAIVCGPKKVELIEQGKNKFIRGFICFQKIYSSLFVLCLIFITFHMCNSLYSTIPFHMCNSPNQLRLALSK